MHKKNEIKAYLAGIIFAVLIGFSFLGVKISVSHATSNYIMAYRFDFAFVAMLIFWLITGERLSFKGRSRKKILGVGFFYSAFMLLQVVGFSYATSIEAAIIFAAAPIFVVILATIFLKEKSTFIQTVFVLVVIVALGVMAVLNAGNISFNPKATFILIISTICMASYTVLIRGLRDEYHPGEISSITIIFGFVTFNVWMIIDSIGKHSIDTYLHGFSLPSLMGATAYLGVFCVLISTMLIGYMSKHLSSVVISVMGNISTSISIVVGAVILNEPIYTFQIICTLVIIAGIVGVAKTGKEN